MDTAAGFANYNGLPWPKLVGGTLISRYKRFLADVKLEKGPTVTAHCPNTGSMKGCCEPGRPVYLSVHDNPRRKLKYTWELIQMPASLVGVNTQVPNRLVFESVRAGSVPELSGYRDVVREVKISAHSRIDLALFGNGRRPCYVEIKNCTLVEDAAARFPDAVTARGLKHIRELEARVKAGCRAVMFYFIQRMDAKIFKPADDIDEQYGRQLRNAAAQGVEILAYDVAVDLDRIRLNRNIPVAL